MKYLSFLPIVPMTILKRPIRGGRKTDRENKPAIGTTSLRMPSNLSPQNQSVILYRMKATNSHFRFATYGLVSVVAQRTEPCSRSEKTWCWSSPSAI